MNIFYSVHCKSQTRPLVRNGAQHQQTRNCVRETKIKGPNWGCSARGKKSKV
jgi:hypothetical protein